MSNKLRLHVALKPAPKLVSAEPVWKLPGVNMLKKPVSKLVYKPLLGGGLKPASMWFRRACGACKH